MSVRKGTALLLVVLGLCQHAAVAQTADRSYENPQLYVSENWEQGGIGMAFVYPVVNISKIKFTLINSKGRASVTTDAVPYRFSRKDGGYIIGLGLLGLYPAFGSGEFTLKVEIEGPEGAIEYRRAVTVASNEYRTTTVRMGSQGTAAKFNVSPERSEQARRFYAVLGNFNDQANYYSGKFRHPVNAETWRTTGQFWDIRKYIYTNGKVENGAPHNGVDYAGLPVGTPVLAAADGRVVMAEHRIITGHTVVIEHMPGVFSLYYHMNDTTVQVGKKVKAGKMIGRLGSTGFSTGPHLHFGVRVSKVDIDPNWVLNHPLVDYEYILSVIKNADTVPSLDDDVTESQQIAALPEGNA
jgi:murein DD-endopeptidase MepM/ murein hydrolase activator NlpD